MNKKVAIILINYKEYAKKYLDDCLCSIREQDFSGLVKLYIVDNASSEETASYLKDKAPEAELIINKGNDGFAKGNNDAILKAIEESFDYVFLLNMDTIADKSALSKLVESIEKNDKIGAVQSRLMLHPDKERINSLGNSTHFLGFGFCLSYGDKYEEEKVKDLEKIFYPSGAAVLFRVSVLKELGLFDEDYFMYSEDQDLGWRIWLAGYLCALSKDSVVYHKYEFARSISKYYYMDRNRIITALKNYRLVTLIILAPAFIVMEIGLLYFSIKNGWYKEKIKIWLEFFTLDFWKKIKKGRKEVIKIRKVKDKDLFKMMSGKISYQEISSPLLFVANLFLNMYFIFVKFLLRLFNI